MKCFRCKTGKMKELKSKKTISLDGTDPFEIEGVRELICSSCEHQYMSTDAIEEENKKILIHLVREFKPNALPGKVAAQMRRMIGLSANELTHEVGHGDPSTFAKASASNRSIDPYSATVLICLCDDFITGGTQGAQFIKKMKNPASILPKATFG